MMVVLLIMSIILAAMAPVMTTRMSSEKSSENTSPWRWVQGRKNLDAYLRGNLDNQRAIIGDNTIATDGTENARLIIKTSDSVSIPMMFKDKDDNKAVLTITSKSIGLGRDVLKNDSNGNNLAIGHEAARNISSENNIAIGYYALRGSEPNDSGTATSTGNNNIAIGNGALRHNSTGQSNVAIGYQALKSNTTGTGNIALGYSALNSSETASYNTAIGYQALESNTTGGSNTALGAYALKSNTTGIGNTAIGAYALNSNTEGFNNTALGFAACAFVLGSNKTCIGNWSGPAEGSTLAASDNSDRVIFLGDINTTVYIPGRLVVGGQAYIGDNLKYSPSLYVGMKHNDDSTIRMRRIEMRGILGGSNNDNNLFGNGYASAIYSDRRLKNIGKEYTSSLDKIRRIKPLNFTFKKDKNKTPHVGVIAQDLQKIFPDAVQKDSNGYLTIRQEDMFYAVINAIKELDAKITALINKETAKDRKIKELEKRIELLEKKLK